MSRLMLLGLVLIVVTYSNVQGQALRIDSITPQPAEPGQTIVIQGHLGPNDHNKVIRLARIDEHHAQFFQATILQWTSDQAEVVIPRTAPPDRYLVTIVYPARPTWHSNNFILTIREPAPPARGGRDDNPVVVLPNRCLSRPRRRASRSSREYEVSTGGLLAPCETMRKLNEEQNASGQPGSEVTIMGDFGRRREDQRVALAQPVDADGQRGPEPRLQVSHLLQIAAWSSNQVTVRIGERVRPDNYSLLILNRLSRNVVPGVFEQGSNAIQFRVRR